VSIYGHKGQCYPFFGSVAWRGLAKDLLPPTLVIAVQCGTWALYLEGSKCHNLWYHFLQMAQHYLIIYEWL